MPDTTLSAARFSLGTETHTKVDNQRIQLTGIPLLTPGTMVQPFDIKRAVTGWDGDYFVTIVNGSGRYIPKAALKATIGSAVDYVLSVTKRNLDAPELTAINAYLYVEDGVVLCHKTGGSLALYINLTGKGVERAAAPKGKKVPTEEIFWTEAYRAANTSRWDPSMMRSVTKFTPEWENVYKYRDYYVDFTRDADGRFTSVKVTYVERPKPRCAGPAYAFVGDGNEWSQRVVPELTAVCPPGSDIAAVESKFYLHPSITSQSMFMSQKDAEDFFRRNIGGR